MIDINELKPVLADIFGDREDTSQYIDRIIALDKPTETSSNTTETDTLKKQIDDLNTETDALKKQIDDLNKSWEQRYRDGYFKGIDTTETKPETPEYQPYIQQEKLNPMETITIDDLFTIETKGDGK